MEAIPVLEKIFTDEEMDEIMAGRVDDVIRETQRARANPPETLSAFIRAAWHVLEPTTVYRHGWHIDAIAEHLDAVIAGEIRNLVINIPPRHMKSLTVSVFWPAWVWTFAPSKRWLFASYAEKLAIRDNLKCRRLIRSPWYRTLWGDVFSLTGDQNQKSRFENDKTGYRIATGVGGGATGDGGELLICDDPHKTQEGESDLMRNAVLTWWSETMSTRLNDPSTGAKVIVMQRVHENDLSGHVLETGNYEHLCLPAEYEPTVYVTGIGFADPRTKEGDLLWPEHFTREAVDALKRELGDYGAAGQLQQRPVPRGGGMFKEENWRYVDAAPYHASRVRYWDKAGTAGAGAFTAGLRYSRDEQGRFYVEDVVRGQWEAPERERSILETAENDVLLYGNTVHIHHEQEPGSGGKESAQATARMLAAFPNYADRVTGAKEVRAEPVASQQAAGNVYIVRGSWDWKGFVRRAAMFPAGRYKDEIDCLSGAHNKLAPVNRPAAGVMQQVAQPTQSRIVKKAPTGGRFRRTKRTGYR